ncbi:MAG: putative peptidase family protein, partial [Frankiales bacterium]|nr:putative peptidase family protein [Frankiales bacterium]
SAAPSAAPAPASSRAPESLSASSRPTVVKVPAARASAKPVATRTPAAKPAAKVPAVQPLQGLPAVQKAPSSAVARKAVAGALSVVGSPHFSDARLVRDAWRHAGGGTLPSTRVQLVAKARPVPLADARVGDLVVYGSPAHHVALYRGHGYMVAASASYGKVVVRRVFQAPLVRLFRLPG